MSPSPIENFIVAIDQAWTGDPGPKILLRVIGSTALMLQADYVRGTKDSDVLEAADLTRRSSGSFWRWRGRTPRWPPCTACTWTLWPGGCRFSP